MNSILVIPLFCLTKSGNYKAHLFHTVPGPSQKPSWFQNLNQDNEWTGSLFGERALSELWIPSQIPCACMVNNFVQMIIEHFEQFQWLWGNHTFQHGVIAKP